MHRTASLTVALLVVLIACGPGSSGLQGVSCTEDRDCGSGLRCLTESLPSTDGGCTGLGKECLTLCSTDTECTTSLGPGYACSSGPCGADVPTCQALASSPEDSGGSLEATVPSDATGPSDGTGPSDATAQ
jgi:hypothetical protein